VKLLLDTNALIWALVRPERLSKTAIEAVTSPANRIYVSVISAWEIGMLRAKKGVRLPSDLEFQIADKDFDALPLTMGHALAVEALPSLHNDPFDRMLVAQAQVEGMTIVTSDRVMRRYPVATLPAI
jgi:PIN domain nuclease of toxin-antitoxin system